MGKLVRDRIPEIIIASGRTAQTRVMGEDEYRRELLTKLVEEAREALEAEPDDLREELADVWEVLDATAAANGISLRDIQTTAERKRSERGGFEQRLYLH